MNKKIIHEGKTKQILEHSPELVEVHLTDQVTAGNGKSKVVVPGKGNLSKIIAVNCFRLLQAHGVPISFVEDAEPTWFKAINTKMAPLEVVVRGIATGSYLKRNPAVGEGHVFDKPVVEFFYKDDAQDDPILNRQYEGQIALHRADMPVNSGSLIKRFAAREFCSGERWNLWGGPMDQSKVNTLFEASASTAVAAYKVLAEAWRKIGFTLVDIKFEMGIHPGTGAVLISDAITPDEWRLWKDGDRSQAYDKDPFRKSQEKDGLEIQQLILDRYAKIAQLTAAFHC